MTVFYLIPAALSALLLGAHFLRAQQYGLVLFSLALIPLLCIPRPWAGRMIQIVLVWGAAVWGQTTLTLLRQRMAQGEPFLRMVLILGSVALVAVLAALLVQTARLRRYFSIIPASQDAPAATE